jgi:hypothetical protein
VILAVAVIAVSQSAPIPAESNTARPAESNTARFAEAAAKEIKSAETELLSMKKIEKTEIGDMNTIGKDAKSAEKANTVALDKDMESKSKQAALNEDAQQATAHGVLSKVSNIIKSFHTAGIAELGESKDNDNAKAALNQLETVEKRLSKETATMHTKAKIEEIAKDANTLSDLETEGGKSLGETLDNAPSATPSLNDLAKAANAQHQASSQQDEKTKTGTGAASLLASLPAGQEEAAPQKSANVQHLLQKIERQEKFVASAEANNEVEVDHLAAKLN